MHHNVNMYGYCASSNNKHIYMCLTKIYQNRVNVGPLPILNDGGHVWKTLHKMSGLNKQYFTFNRLKPGMIALMQSPNGVSNSFEK